MAALRDATARGEELILSTDNWERTASHFATFSIAQKLRRLLEYVGSKSQNRAGARVVINDQQRALGLGQVLQRYRFDLGPRASDGAIAGVHVL